MVFADSYREMFATVGVELGTEDACPPADVEDAERRLGVRVPRCLKEYYLLCGREKRLNQFHNRLLPPGKWFTDSGHVVFMEENQRVVYWGVAADREAKADARVFQGVNRREGIEWHPEHDSCFTFLKVMALWHASFGGAVGNRAVGYVEATARNMLDGEWQLVGEVNDMRAYRQDGRAICFLKWEPRFLFEKKLNRPPWRAFAAAASEADLQRIKASLPAGWEHWGG